MQIESNKPLKSLNTFGIEASANRFLKLDNRDQLKELENLTDEDRSNLLVLGGGSNILLTKDFEGLVIQNNLKGIRDMKTQSENVWVRCEAGEEWHDLVMYCVRKGYGGIENLSLIPGKVGAAPMQNIGAYGVELKDVFEELEAFDIANGIVRTFDKEDCRFGYRESIFKHELKGRFIILSVTLKLSKESQLNYSYGDIERTLQKMGVEPSIRSISDAVISIRRSKLPDPAELGNAGSFFKNLEMPLEQYDELKSEYPEMPGYDLPDNMKKVPTAWLIDQCGLKGFRVGNVGVHEKHALVLVNYGGAKGEDLKDLAGKIQEKVRETFGLLIYPEVNII